MKEERAKKDEYQKALSIYSDAMKEFRKGKFDRVSEILRNFLEKHTAEKELVDRARIYLAISEQRAKTEKDVVPLKTLDDYYQYGVYKMNGGDLEEALKLFEKAEKMNPDEPKIIYLMADLLCQKGQHEASLEYLKKAIQMDKFFKILAQNETDFEPLWEDKRFKLITRMI
ncbi:MAG: tetratricopeptide repeat protein [Candidatus Aminicenantales bacterium]